MAVKDAESSLKQCFRTILQLIELDIVELWIRGQKGLSVRYIYRGNFPNNDSKRFSFNESESKKLIEKSMTRDTFYFTSNKSDLSTNEKNFSSRVCFHLPAQNVSTDVFLVGYSVGVIQVCRCTTIRTRKFDSYFGCLKLIPAIQRPQDIFILLYILQFTAQKTNLFYWLGHSACAVAFAADPVEADDKQRQIEKTSTSEHFGRDVLHIFEDSASTPTVSTSNNNSQTNDSERSIKITFSSQIVAPQDATGDVKLFIENSSVSSNVSDSSTRGTRHGDQSTADLRRMDLELIYNASSNLRNSSESLKINRNSAASQSSRVERNEIMVTKGKSNTPSTPVRRGSLNYQEISAIRKEANHVVTSSTACSNERDRPCGPEQSESGNQSRGASVSVCSDNVTMGSALTSITGITRTKPNKPQRPMKAFDYHITDLPLLRDINRRVDLNEMVALEYVTGGSHSQIYSAMWHGQSVIVKVRNAKVVSTHKHNTTLLQISFYFHVIFMLSCTEND